MSIEHTLLGLIKHEPRHGYDLAREFAPDTVLGEIAHLEPGMLYAHLKKLERDGAVRSVLQAQGARPPRRVFEITETGNAGLRDWLSRPVEHTRDLRLEFLLKLYIARLVAPENAPALIERQHAVCERFVGSLDEQLAGEPDEFRRLVLEMRLAQNQALLTWLAQARQQVVV